MEDEDGSFEGAKEVIDGRETGDNIPDKLDADGLNLVISLHALLVTGDSQTMRVQDCIKQHRVILLVNSGSIHNFIDQAMVKRIGCKTQSINDVGVSVANGERMLAYE